MRRLLIGAGDKSALLRHFIIQDYPHVSLIDTDTLSHSVADHSPKEFWKQINYFDPSDALNIASFNVFNDVKDKAKFVQDIVSVLDALFPGGQNTLTRQNANYVLSNILTILSDNLDVTFESVLEFVFDESYRTKCLKWCKNKIAKDNWARIEEWDKGQRKASFTQIEVKIGTLLLSPVLYRTLAQRPFTFSPRESDIFIADLSRLKLGDDASKMLGTLLISSLPTPLYINDFGFFATEHLGRMIAKGEYTVAVGSLSELPKSVQEVVLAADEKYVFRVTEADAVVLQPYISGVNKHEILMDLGDGEFRGTLPVDITPTHGGRFRGVRKRSIAWHCRRAE